MVDNILAMKMTRPIALRIVREIAEDTGRLFIVPHAKSRMRARRINRSQVYSCLRQGSIVEGPYKDIHGFWRCKFQRFAAGEEISVVVAFNSRELVNVITVME